MKKCPFCAEEIQQDAVKCRFCSENLIEEPDRDIFSFIEENDIEALKTVLKEDVNKRGPGQWTPLHLAVLEENRPVAELLLDHDADINAADDENWTPLHIAVQEGHVDMTRLLIDCGADPGKCNDMNQSPIDIADEYRGKYMQILAMLMECNSRKASGAEDCADIDAAECRGEEIPLKCRNCGKSNEASSRYCNQCGELLEI